MAYRTYTTRAVVCGSRDSYTSDRSYLLFTEDAGMIWASARSVRMEKSKQRYALQDFSILRVSLVRGRSGWKIGSSEALGNGFLAATTREERGIVTAMTRLLRRYVHGEEVLPAVFADTVATFDFVSVAEPDAYDPLLQLYTLRLLHALGYVRTDESIAPLLDAGETSDALVSYEPSLEGMVAKHITQAEEVSHL